VRKTAMSTEEEVRLPFRKGGQNEVIHNHERPLPMVYRGFSKKAPQYHVWKCRGENPKTSEPCPATELHMCPHAAGLNIRAPKSKVVRCPVCDGGVTQLARVVDIIRQTL